MDDRPLVRLTERDALLLADLIAYRYLSVEQVQKLHFPSEQTTYRRLRALKAAGYVDAFAVPGFPHSVFYVTRLGASLVAPDNESPGTKFLRAQPTETPKDYYFLKHFLTINDFRIALFRACTGSQISLQGFIPDFYGKKTERGGVTKHIRDEVKDISSSKDSISHTPDAVFVLEKDAKHALFLLEVDRGTEVVSDPQKGVLKALRFYLNYLILKGYQRYADEFGLPSFQGFRALIVTTSLERITNIRQAALTLPHSLHAKRFVWLTTLRHVEPGQLFGSIWLPLDATDDKKYRIG